MATNQTIPNNRSQLVRVIVLGVAKGLVSIASLMIMAATVGEVKHDSTKAMILTGFAGLLIGACNMAIWEFLSVCSQLDMELSTMTVTVKGEIAERGETESLESPVKAALVSAASFSVGAVLPLLPGALIREYRERVGVVVGVASVALLGFGWLGAELGMATNKVRSTVRILVGSWLAMAITCGLTKLIVLSH